jgi:hypothetical protein
MMISLADKLSTIQAQQQSDIGLLLAPRMAMLPLPMQRFDDPFLPFGKAIIDATRDLTCAYIFDLASYLAIGAAGAIALERTLAYVRSDTVTILHGLFAGPDYAGISEEGAFTVDAVTLIDGQYLDFYLRRPDRSAFIVRGVSPAKLDASDLGGYYWNEAQIFTMLGTSGQILQIHMISDSVLYASQGEDFAERARAELEKRR